MVGRVLAIVLSTLLPVPGVVAGVAAVPSSPAPCIRIAFYNGGGTFVGSKQHEVDFYAAVNTAAAALSTAHRMSYQLTNITQSSTVELLTRANFDLVIFPGGSGTGQSNALGAPGRAAVQAFVRDGGGYIGTCGGAFLALTHLKLYGNPSPPTVQPWARGHGPVRIEFTHEGVTSLDLPESVYGDQNVTIEYWQGPIVATADMAKYSPQVSILSVFRTEIHNSHTNETTGNMVNTPAMTSAMYGKGRVVLNSPHPEIPPETSGGQPGLPAGRTRPEISEGELAWVLGLINRTVVTS
jgi:glutamine amidotransferase-like uncharacterized protein